ncbi:hypothetical protein [Desulfatibacillum aliphaticivorans]|uniref:hypothetical protein n=1 Tax=Desulfatibacillum aliphaticivorans TaxID=218208 RepID=UPI0010A48C98|nr:hypothetical protein [Desulfatibacillum aliphaticivorans]
MAQAIIAAYPAGRVSGPYAQKYKNQAVQQAKANSPDSKNLRSHFRAAKRLRRRNNGNGQKKTAKNGQPPKPSESAISKGMK